MSLETFAPQNNRAKYAVHGNTTSSSLEVSHMLSVLGEVVKFECSICVLSFGSQTALSSHNRHKHDYRNPIAAKVATTFCLCCGTEFHASARLFKHVNENSARCNKYYLDNVEDVVDLTCKAVKSGTSKSVLKPCIKGLWR